jgi:hypothetical protein
LQRPVAKESFHALIGEFNNLLSEKRAKFENLHQRVVLKGPESAFAEYFTSSIWPFTSLKKYSDWQSMIRAPSF